MDRFFIQTDKGQFCLYHQRLETPKGVICILHGSGEYGLCYEQTAVRLSKRGYGAFAIDLYGHGYSSGERGAIGSRDDVFSAVDRMLDSAQNEYAGVPVFLLGHSMGGLIALAYRLMREGAPFAGYAASSPWLRLNAMKYSPEDMMAYAELVRKNPELIIRTQVSKEDLHEGAATEEKDPMLHGKMALGAVFERMEDVDTVFAGAGEKRPPVYLFAGRDDPICNPEGTAELAKAVGKDCTFYLWDGMKHNLLNDQREDEVVDRLADWLDSVIEKISG